MFTHRLIVVSNRVPSPTTDEGGSAAGGLVSALLPLMQDTNRVVWLGWSGEEGDPDAPPCRRRDDGVEYATIDLSAEEVQAYYEEFCNRLLWPLMHGMPDRARAHSSSCLRVYRAVNRRFAQAIMQIARPDDLVWVHDYHLISVGAELRRLGWRGRIGYFHHIPVPVREHWDAIPGAPVLAADLEAYDLLGVQTQRDATRLRALVPDLDPDRVGAYPISIDPERFREAAEECDDDPLRDVRRPQVFFGADRLDYTKALPARVDAFGRALAADAAMRRGAAFVQWAAPSRTGIPEYQDERAAVEAAVERVEDEVGGALTVDFESHAPPEVARALRHADVCVVSSAADGMNLVAKEFAAVHSAEHPGVLVLSDGCGAAEELGDALIVPAGDDAALARALRQAFHMPLAERRARSQRLRDHVDQHTSSAWLDAFVGDLLARAPCVAAAATRGYDSPMDLLRDRVEGRLREFERTGVVDRLWARDHTLWKPSPDEIANRLGWLDIDLAMAERTGDLRDFARSVRAEGYTTAVLLGMGGSSLAPRVFQRSLTYDAPALDLVVLDTTVPGEIRSVADRLPPGRTLYLVSSKSGTTLETRSLLSFFSDREPDGRHYVAITDPGSPLEQLARERDFRRVFSHPADIGGRYAALSYVGLVPAALLGIDLDRLLEGAASMREACQPRTEVTSNPGARLGAALAEAALLGHDILPLVECERDGIGDWVQQLIAESTGKQGIGILPITIAGAESSHLLTTSQLLGDAGGPSELRAREDGELIVAAHPPVDPFHLGAEFYCWEYAVAMVGHVLGINPFDQPDVEAAKAATRQLLDTTSEAADVPPVEGVLDDVSAHQYVALHAYLPRTPENDRRLRRVSTRIRKRCRVPVTTEYGPALLHSTGQYHKGGGRRGVFIQVVEPPGQPLEVPGREYSFDDLTEAQAAGDRTALAARDRVATQSTLDALDALDALG